MHGSSRHRMIEFFDKLAGRYARTSGRHFDSLFREEALVEINRMLTKSANSNKKIQILEAGCGNGALTIKLLKHHNVHITAIDFSNEMLNVLRKRINAENKKKKIRRKVTLLNSDIMNIPFKKKFDIVIFINVLPNIVDKIALTKIMARLSDALADGGFMVISVVNRYSLTGFFLMLKKNSEIKKTGFFFLIWFVIFFLIRSSNSPFNDFLMLTNISAWRYALILYIPIIIFSSFAVMETLNKFRLKKFIAALLIIFFVLSLYFTIPFINSKTYMQEGYNFLKNNENLIPTDCFFISNIYLEKYPNYLIPNLNTLLRIQELKNNINENCVLIATMLSPDAINALNQKPILESPQFDFIYRNTQLSTQLVVYNIPGSDFIAYSTQLNVI